MSSHGRSGAWRRLRGWPWPFLLLIVGAAVASTRLVAPVSVPSSIVLAVFLPPLLFDAGFSMEMAAVRRELRWILLLGLAGSAFAAALTVAILVALRFPVGEAFLLGAVLAATDPISVFAALRRLRTPPRLRLALEGESLVNDAVAVVLFAIALALNQGGRTEPIGLAGLFLRQTAVGLGVGALTGVMTRRALRILPARADLPLTLVASYLAYLVSDRLGGSGLLSVIALALVLGTAPQSPAHHRIRRFWRQLGFVIACIAFLLVGLQVRVEAILALGFRLVLLVLTIWIARIVMVLVVTASASRLWPWRLRAALSWAGLRGALALALALSIPAGTPRRAEALALVVGVVFVSLALQGLSLGPVFGRLGVAGSQAAPTVG
ncbi:MAG: cation:proton antiporter [Candidatus Dormibacter sp.]